MVCFVDNGSTVENVDGSPVNFTVKSRFRGSGQERNIHIGISFTMKCIEVKNTRSLVHCSVWAINADIYNFAFKFHEEKCWICRGSGTPSIIALDEELKISVYITGIAHYTESVFLRWFRTCYSLAWLWIITCDATDWCPNTKQLSACWN